MNKEMQDFIVEISELCKKYGFYIGSGTCDGGLNTCIYIAGGDDDCEIYSFDTDGEFRTVE